MIGGEFGRLCKGEPSVTPAYQHVKNICLMSSLAETNGTAAKLPLAGEGDKEGAPRQSCFCALVCVAANAVRARARAPEYSYVFCIYFA